jgi:hypothetical protein
VLGLPGEFLWDWPFFGGSGADSLGPIAKLRLAGLGDLLDGLPDALEITDVVRGSPSFSHSSGLTSRGCGIVGFPLIFTIMYKIAVVGVWAYH